jgi:MFS family permease
MSSSVRGGDTESGATLREGVLAGLIGAVVVAGWFLVLDLVIGRLFFTPAALGSALFLGAEGVAAVRITAGTVLGYTLVHVAAFLVAGVVFTALVIQAERQRAVLMGVILLFVTTLTLVVGLMAILASWVLMELTWWGIAIGNLLAAAAMAFFLWRRHPRLARELPEAEERAAARDGMAGPGEERAGPRPTGDETHYRPRGPSTPEGGEPA